MTFGPLTFRPSIRVIFVVYLSRVPVIVGALVGGLVLATTAVVLMCFFCRGCWVYRRRKRLQNGTIYIYIAVPSSSPPPPRPTTTLSHTHTPPDVETQEVCFTGSMFTKYNRKTYVLVFVFLKERDCLVRIQY